MLFGKTPVRLLLPVLFFMVISCKKTNPSTPVTPIGGTGNTPNFVAEYYTSGSRQNGKFVIFDLNHPDNASKKYFVLSLIQAGADYTDSAVVMQPPAPVENIAPGWPAAVQSAAFGLSMNMMVDAKTAVSSNAGSPWQFAPILTSTNLYRKLNDPDYAGTLAGKKPYGNSPLETEYKKGPSYKDYQVFYRDITYYFKDGLYTSNLPGVAPLPFDSLFAGASQIDWKNVDQVIKVDIDDLSTHVRHFSRFLYFDWTNWRYWVVAEKEETALYLSYPPVYYIGFVVRGPLSLNRLCKWPDGWGKK